MIKWPIIGIISAAILVIIKMWLSRLDLPHYPLLVLEGQAGLKILGLYLGMGAAYALLFGWLLRHALPKGLLLSALLFAVLPFIVGSIAWPLYQGRPAISDAWALLWMGAHELIYALGVVFIGQSGASSRGSSED